MTTIEVKHGFQLDRIRTSEELGGKLWEMTHLQTGAQLVWLDNKENNKLFSIAFKTLPQDDTGVFHILEHSVLNGSKRFPVKEPFVELLKSSMNTFLNAMTFPDKTVYPVSSRNEQDYLNLTRVYLDAVFCPAIYENPCIFQQEGWHYDIHEGDDMPTYKGVVFNEMKGAFSSSDTLIENSLMRALFPDNCYRFVSGGDPKYIPKLSYEQFLAAHREYYHPGNARIYLDGDVPLDKVLAMLDEYLSRFEADPKRHTIAMQSPVAASQTVEYYEIGEDEDEESMTHMAIGKVVCDWSDRKKLMALSVLSSYLTGSNEAPLKRAILDSGLAQDVGFGVSDGIAQPYCVLQIRNTEYTYREEIKAILRRTVQDMVQKGLDSQELEAVINQMEFQALQMGEPKGLERNLMALNSWLYDGDPMLYLTYGSLFTELRQQIGTGYYEGLLREVLLEEANTAEVYLLPSKTKGEEDWNRENAELANAWNAWTEEERDRVLEMNRRLEAWQSTPDTPQALASLPVLSLSDVSAEPEWMETEEYTVGGTTVLLHKTGENGIVHVNLHFSLADFQPDELSALSFMTNLFGELPTKNHAVAELQREIRKNIGLLDFNVTAYTRQDAQNQCRPFFTVTCSTLSERIPAAVNLILELLKDTVFTGKESAAAIEKILRQGEEGMRQSIMVRGNGFASRHALSHFTAGAAAQERMGGYGFYCWLRAFAEDTESKLGRFQTFAQSAADRIFNACNLTMSVTARQRCPEAEKIIALLKKPSGERNQYMTIPVDGTGAKEFIQIPAGVSYAVSAGNLPRYGWSYEGGLSVLSTILSYGYLWNEVRVQGGAYGCGFQAGETGNALFYSYRDPSPQRSLQVYGGTAEFVRQFCASDEMLDKYIISTVSAMEPLRTPRESGAAADADYLCGISLEFRRQVRQQMLKLTKQDLLRYCELFDTMARENALCVVGGNAPTQADGNWTVYKL